MKEEFRKWLFKDLQNVSGSLNALSLPSYEEIADYWIEKNKEILQKIHDDVLQTVCRECHGRGTLSGRGNFGEQCSGCGGIGRPSNALCAEVVAEHARTLGIEL